eukprot:Sspe_Gene.20106::Locus_7363_Transcript_1_1_Confidence_1.000_Length_938::g.20106::m.20106
MSQVSSSSRASVNSGESRKSSVRSRCSLAAASPAAQAAHDNKIEKALAEGNVSFLVNLLGPTHTVARMIKSRYTDLAMPLIIEGKTTREEVRYAVKQEYPRDSQFIMRWYDTLVLQSIVAPYFSKSDRGSEENIIAMIEAAGGEALDKGDKGIVFCFAEACRRQDELVAAGVAFKAGRSAATYDVLHIRATTSQQFCLRDREKKLVTAMCTQLSEKRKQALGNPDANLNPFESSTKKDSGGCCVVM